MSAWLETEAGDPFPLQGTCSFGRDLSNTFVLNGTMVSRHHAMIHSQGKGEHWLVDLGSSNGIVLNGRRVKQPVALKDLDKLEIGPHRFLYRHTASAPHAHPSLADTTRFLSHPESSSAELWLLVADIEQFTPLSQTMPGDQLATLVGRWIATCKTIIEGEGGEINKFLGDGFLAFWPAANTPPDVVSRTVAGLHRVQATHTLPFRMALHFGAVTVDSSLSAGEDSLIGPEVNFLFRLEKLAGSINQRCLLSAAAASRLNSHCTVVPLGEHALSGFAGTHAAYGFNPASKA